MAIYNGRVLSCILTTQNKLLMAQHVPQALQNTFLSSTEGNFDLYRDCSEHTDEALLSKISDPFFAGQYNFFHPFHVAFMGRFNAWHAAEGDQQGDTRAVNLLLQELQSTHIDLWDRKIQDVYNKHTPRYKSLLPNGHAPFQHGSQENKIDAVSALILNMGNDVSLATVKGLAQRFLDDVATAQSTKKGKFTTTDTDSAEVEVTRVKGAQAMFKCMSDLNSNFFEDPSRSMPYFNWEALHPGTQKEFMLTIKPGTVKLVAKRKLVAGTPVMIENMSTATAQAFCGETKEATSPAGNSITVEGDKTTDVTAEQIGNAAETPYIIVKNLDANVKAHIRIVIGR